MQANGRSSMIADDYAASSPLDHSLCSNGNCFNVSALRESRFSVGNPLSPVVNQQESKPNNEKDRPVILGAGSPALMQPNIGDTDSSLLLANSSKFSQQMQATW